MMVAGSGARRLSLLILLFGTAVAKTLAGYINAATATPGM